MEVVLAKTSTGKEDVWLDVETMSQLFEKDRSVISKHVRKIYADGEVGNETFRTETVVTEKSGKKYRSEKKYYNLDVILSVGYKTNGRRGTEFRRWANDVLGKYLRKGYAVNEKVLMAKGLGEVV